MTDPMRIVSIGDSIIYGRHDPNGGWVGHLRRYLEGKDKWAAVFNLGIGGHTSSDVLARLEQETTVRTPNTVIMGFGMNDIRSDAPYSEPNVSADQFKSNVITAIRILRTHNVARVIMAQMHPIDSELRELEGLWYPEERWSAYNTITSDIAHEYDAEVIPFNQLGDFSIFTGNLSDPIHPSPRGHERMAEFAIRSLFSR